MSWSGLPDKDKAPEVPELAPEAALALVEVDLELEGVYRELDEYITEWVEPIDRGLVIQFLRMAYLIGKGDYDFYSDT